MAIHFLKSLIFGNDDAIETVASLISFPFLEVGGARSGFLFFGVSMIFLRGCFTLSCSLLLSCQRVDFVFWIVAMTTEKISIF